MAEISMFSSLFIFSGKVRLFATHTFDKISFFICSQRDPEKFTVNYPCVYLTQSHLCLSPLTPVTVSHFSFQTASVSLSGRLFWLILNHYRQYCSVPSGVYAYSVVRKQDVVAKSSRKRKLRKSF